MDNCIPFHSGLWKGLGHSRFMSQFSDLESWLTEHPGERVVDKPDREVRKVVLGQQVVYVKLVRALGSGGNPLLRLIHAAKWRCRPSRATVTFQTHMKMLQRGIQCPLPLLAARKRGDKGPVDCFISEEAPYPIVRFLLLDETRRKELLEACARGVAALHMAGFVHGDCIPGNLLLTPQQDIVFIDNDRTHCYSIGYIPNSQRRRNLVQFGSRLPVELDDPKLPLYFLSRYYECLPQFQTERAQVEEIIRKRRQYILTKEHPRTIAELS